MDKDALVQRLGELLLRDPEVVREGWAAVVLVVTVAPASPDVCGFCYDGEGACTTIAPSAFDTPDAIRELHVTMAAEAGASPWCSCLIRLARDTRRLALEFEYSDPARWAVTLANRRERAEALRLR